MDKMLPTTFMQQLHYHVRKIEQVMLTGRFMNMAMAFFMLSTRLVLVNGTVPGSDLSYFYYDGLCPGFDAFATLKFRNLTDAIVAPKIAADPGLPAALMRLAFHDCFVQGCDASILLNSTTGDSPAEKDAIPNITVRGYEVIDAVKAALELVCPGVFSCADILQEVALAAQKYVNQTSFKASWLLRYGRRDGLVSLATDSNNFLPPSSFNYTQLVENFDAQGLNTSDLVHLSGAHTYGISHCISFTQRLYNFSGNGTGTDPALNATFAQSLKDKCPPGSPFNVINMDVTTPSTFDNEYYNNIYANKSVFTSDDALKSAPFYVGIDKTSNPIFLLNFAFSFTKMTEIKVKKFPNGQIRSNCALRN